MLLAAEAPDQLDRYLAPGLGERLAGKTHRPPARQNRNQHNRTGLPPEGRRTPAARRRRAG